MAHEGPCNHLVLEVDLQLAVGGQVRQEGDHVAEAHAVVTTALVPGRKAPCLIPSGLVARMAPGSVIVDMAADSGGNCELSEPATEVVTERGVIIIGPDNLPGSVAHTTSTLYSNNLATFYGGD